jgi:hypothetical protein
LKAPETLIDVGLTFVPEPAVVQPDGQISPGEWYTIISPAVGLAPFAEESMDRMTEPLGLQSTGGSSGPQIFHCCPFGSAAKAITVSPAAVRHDAGAVKVVVSGPLLKKAQPEREVAVGMAFTCEDFEVGNQEHTSKKIFAAKINDL